MHSSALVPPKFLPHLHDTLVAYGFGSAYGLEAMYTEPQTIGEAESSNETDLLQAGESKITKVPGGATLVDQILHHAKRGVTRKELNGIAEQYGFNTGSVSPTLVKLVKAKRIFRIGKGVYSTQKPTKK